MASWVFSDRIWRARFFPTLFFGIPFPLFSASQHPPIHFFYSRVPHKSLNCSKPSGASETMTYPIGIYVVRMEVTGEEGDGDDEDGKLGSTWLFRSGHQTRLKPFQTTFQFWMVVCHQGDTGSIYHSNTASDGVKQLGHLCGIHILKCLLILINYLSHYICKCNHIWTQNIKYLDWIKLSTATEFHDL